MPAAANMVLNDAGAVARTFALLSPASGYGSNAEWAYALGAIVAVHPRITASARVNPAKKSRITQLKLRVPHAIVDTTTSVTSVGSAFECNVTATMPDDFPVSLRPDARAFAVNMMANAIVTAMMENGVPAT